MRDRAIPPDDITPYEFFTSWIAERVDADAVRRERLGETQARLVFVLTDAPGSSGIYTVHVEGGRVRGEAGHSPSPDLQVEVDIETWRALNRGELSAPEALLRRRLHFKGSLLLALKLHLILG